MPDTLLTEPPLHLGREPFHVGRILRPHGPPPGRTHRVIAVLPAYNAERTLAATLADFPAGCVDEVILVDDGSKDRTVEVARDDGPDGHRPRDRTRATAATRRPATGTALDTAPTWW